MPLASEHKKLQSSVKEGRSKTTKSTSKVQPSLAGTDKYSKFFIIFLIHLSLSLSSFVFSLPSLPYSPSPQQQRSQTHLQQNLFLSPSIIANKTIGDTHLAPPSTTKLQSPAKPLITTKKITSQTHRNQIHHLLNPPSSSYRQSLAKPTKPNPSTTLNEPRREVIVAVHRHS